MANTKAPTPETVEGNWRDRALERSLRTARAKAISRSDKFIETAMEILEETGRTDFTVQELVDRSRTSLRSFYQYFSGKDELLLALLEETIAASVAHVRAEIEGLEPVDGLARVVQMIYAGGDGAASGVNRTMSSYHVNLADAHGDDYKRALEPLGRLIYDLVAAGAASGTVRQDISAERLTRILLQTVVGSALINSLGIDDSEWATDADALWEFCKIGLISPRTA